MMSKKRRKTKAAGGGRSAPIGVADPALPLIERERALSRAAYELFLAEGGGDLEALMENGQCTARAYTSQIRAAEEGGQGWGPTVTPYEDRMTRSLQLRLIKERREWLQDCRRRIEFAMDVETGRKMAAQGNAHWAAAKAPAGPAQPAAQPKPERSAASRQTGAGKTAGTEPTDADADAASQDFAEIHAIAQRSFERMVDAAPVLLEIGDFRRLPNGELEYAGPEHDELLALHDGDAH